MNAAGKIRHYGMCNFGLSALPDLHYMAAFNWKISFSGAILHPLSVHFQGQFSIHYRCICYRRYDRVQGVNFAI